MLLSDLIFECSRAMGLDSTGDDGSTTPSDEFKLMLQWANRGVVDILKQTKCYTEIGTMALTSGVTGYRTDTSILAVKYITVPDSAGNPIALEVVNMEDLLPYLSTLIATTASPMYAAIEGTLMRVAPPPTSAVTLTYIYVPRPTVMSQATLSADPSTATYGGIPSENHDAILAFMKWKAAEYDQQGGGFYRGHAYAPGAAFEAIYEDELKKLKKGMRALGQRGLSPGKIGYPDRGRYPRRNDTYPSYDR